MVYLDLKQGGARIAINNIGSGSGRPRAKVLNNSIATTGFESKWDRLGT